MLQQNIWTQTYKIISQWSLKSLPTLTCQDFPPHGCDCQSSLHSTISPFPPHRQGMLSAVQPPSSSNRMVGNVTASWLWPGHLQQSVNEPTEMQKCRGGRSCEGQETWSWQQKEMPWTRFYRSCWIFLEVSDLWGFPWANILLPSPSSKSPEKTAKEILSDYPQDAWFIWVNLAILFQSPCRVGDRVYQTKLHDLWKLGFTGQKLDL